MKQVKKLLNKYSTQLFLAAVVLLVAGMFIYSNHKGLTAEKITKFEPNLNPAPLGQNENVHVVDSQFASVNDVQTSGLQQSSTPKIDPTELLPKDNNTEWNQLNPAVKANIGDVNFVTPGPQSYMTSSKPLRNANLQLRSDPPVPQVPVSPWNNTTIQPDDSRRPLEIDACK